MIFPGSMRWCLPAGRQDLLSALPAPNTNTGVLLFGRPIAKEFLLPEPKMTIELKLMKCTSDLLLAIPLLCAVHIFVI